MSTGPWSVKGIDPRTREAAKSAARRAGMTLGEWMNHLLMGETAPPAHESARFTAPNSLSLVSGDKHNLQDAIEDLAERLEAAERRSTLAITGIDQSVLGLLTRLEDTEKKFEAHTGAFEESFKALDSKVAKSSSDVEQALRKMDRASEDLARRIDTISEHTAVQVSRSQHDLSKELELVNGRSDELSQRLGAAERMTNNAVRTLEASFAAIDERLCRAEQTLQDNGGNGLAKTFKRRFKALSEELIQGVAQSRAQLAAQIEAHSAAPRLDQLEGSLGRVRERIAETERHHAETLERIAGEVGKLGGALEHRLTESERRTAIDLDQMLDARFRGFQNDHAAAIDKIGDGLAGAISRLEDKFGAMQTQPSGKDDLDERLAAAEQRTAKMVEDSVARIEQRLDSQEPGEEEAGSPVQKAMAALAERLDRLEDERPFDPSAFSAETPPLTDTPETHNPILEDILHPPAAQDQHPALPPLPEQMVTEPESGPEAEPEAGPEAEPDPAMAAAEEAPEEQTGEERPFDPSAFSEEAPPLIDLPEAHNAVLEEILHPPAAQDQHPALPPLPAQMVTEAESGPESETESGPEMGPEAGPEEGSDPAMAATAEDLYDAERQNAAFDSALAYNSGPDPQDDGAPGFAPAAEPAKPLRAGATADADFIAAARRTVSATGAGAAGAAAASGAKPVRSGASRKILMVASMIAIIAVLGAGSVTLLDFDFGGNKDNGAGALASAGVNWDALTQTPGVKPQTDETVPVDQSTNSAAAAPLADQDSPNAGSAALDGAASLSPATAPAVKIAEASARPAPPPAQPDARQDAPQIVSQNNTGQNNTGDTVPKAQPSTAVSTAPLARTLARTLNAPAPQPAPTVAAPAPKGRQTITQAAAAGDPVAQFQLASAKLDAGDGAEGVKLMRQAAERGLPIAQYRMGKIYEDGVLVTKDENAARRWTERAANGGNRRAMHNLAMLYAEGQGVPQNYDKAAKWFQQAALMGLTNSQYNLGFLYEQGLGVPESLEDAYVWYSIAAKAGDAGAKKRVEEIAPSLSAKDKSEALSQIAQFKPDALDLAANGIFNNIAWARPQLNTASSISRAQVLLARLGYKPGPADGNPGTTTRQAVIAYERDNGLAQTGRIDAALLARLENTAVN